MAPDPKEVVYDLLERYITYLPFDEKLDYLSRFIRTGQFERIDNPRNPEDSFAFGNALEKTVPRLTREDSEIVAGRLLKRFTQTQIDSAVAKQLTRRLPRRKARPKESKTKRNSHGSSFKVVIADHDEPLVASELAEFLTLFSEVYALAADLPQDLDPRMLLEGSRVSPESYVTKLRATVDGEIDNQPAELVITRIRKASPLTIWFEGIVTLVIIAAIVSGGSAKIGTFSCKLNALGDGLKKLKAVFANEPSLAKRATAKRTKKLLPPD